MDSRGSGAVGAGSPAIKRRLRRIDAAMWWRPALSMLWPPALAAAVYATVGRLGFFPTDEGLVDAYSYRILHGQIPHRDFISPQPLGSALLHLIDFVIPGPLFEVARFIALCEYIAYAGLLAWLVYAAAPWRWTVAGVCGVVGSVLVNMNIFPLMSWYTVDGLLLCAAGYLVVANGVRRSSRIMVTAGFVVLGAAALTKQSFVPAPAFGWLLLMPILRTATWSARLRRLLETGLTAAALPLIFVSVIGVTGGLHDMRTQLLGTGFVYGRPLVAVWSPRHDLVQLLPLVLSAATLIAVIEWRRRVATSDTTSAALIAPKLLLSAMVIGVIVLNRLGDRGPDWGIWLLWMAIGVLVVRMAIMRSLDVTGVILVSVGWMSSLSYGFPYPNLVGGTLALYMLHRTWLDEGAMLPPLLRPLLSLVAIAMVAVTANLFAYVRTHDVYLDLPAPELTASLKGVSPAFGGIRTNQRTAAYLTQMRDCVSRYPARRVAILPENAAMYPALELQDPFPVDWLWPDAIHGSEARILATVDRLNREGDYLVMFQTVDQPQIISASELPYAAGGDRIAAFTPLADQIYAGLAGMRSTCGSFLIVYAPAASA